MTAAEKEKKLYEGRIIESELEGMAGVIKMIPDLDNHRNITKFSKMNSSGGELTTCSPTILPFTFISNC